MTIGTPTLRKEDKRFLRGKGKYTDNLKMHGMTHAVIVRSPYAHARVKSIDTSAAAVTVSAVLPDTAPWVAVIVVEPATELDARPSLPAALLTVATPVFDELHVTESVRSWVLESVNVPVAVNC